MSRTTAADGAAVRKLLQALRCLYPLQGDRARRFNRQRVLARLKAVREHVDDVYPAPKREPKPRRKRAAANSARMVPLYAKTLAVKAAKAGIRILPTDGAAVYVPQWVADLVKLDPTIKQLTEARRSLTARKALIAAARLSTENSLVRMKDLKRRTAASVLEEARS